MKLGFKYILTLSSLILVACANEDSESPLATNNEITRMSPEERKSKIPNRAFEAVYIKSKNMVAETLNDSPSLFTVHNELGQTPLMVALSLRETDLAHLIVDGLSYEDLHDSDDQGRGYISYAAQFDAIPVIEKIAEKYKASLRFGMARFHNIDFDSIDGKNALFYAANSAVAERLRDFWMQWSVTRGMSWTFWSGFYNSHDVFEQNFLHTAALDNRHDLLRWAMNELCSPAWFQEVDFLFGAPALVGSAIDYAAGWSQRIPLVPDDLVNKANFEGNSPLHLAVRAGHVEASKVLMTCRFVHYRLENSMGRNPLAELLANLDSKQSNIANNYKKIFETLIEKENFISLSRSFKAKMINDQDANGYSALHHAATLMDPFFYLKLQSQGDIYLLSDDGETPESLFLSRHPDQK